ncbi:hypothetical protein HMPREF3201_01987 [Megasphaera sp. MJR8396C]|nr:hypothetical protein HMPREF3201_01987 [Megasphaera sp. MJR8396C]
MKLQWESALLQTFCKRHGGVDFWCEMFKIACSSFLEKGSL